jgi:hypothetical protein
LIVFYNFSYPVFTFILISELDSAPIYTCKNTKRLYICNGKSYTTSSCRLPQDGNIARVSG